MQRYHMRRLWPQFTASTNRGNQAWWTGTLQPTAMSDGYTIGLAYSVPGRPRIRVLSPELKIRSGYSRLPHIFPDGTLCVHTAWEWRADMIIAETIIPWTCAWLYFYEVWIQTGYWLGEGTHPDFPEHKVPDDLEPRERPSQTSRRQG
jgi:hypothetical protein